MPLAVTSSAFSEGTKIPKQYTCDGADMSPALTWKSVPPETKSIALICDDPDAPVGIWVHWVLYNVPPTSTELTENLPKQDTLPNGAKQGKNDFGKIGYGGPCPPKGKPHRYFFKLYALDTQLSLGTGATKQQVEKAMAGHILAQGQLMGTYQR